MPAANVKSVGMTALSTARPVSTRERPLTLGAVAVTLILWASAFVVIRYADRYLSPGPLALAPILFYSRKSRAGAALGDAPLRRAGALAPEP